MYNQTIQNKHLIQRFADILQCHSQSGSNTLANQTWLVTCGPASDNATKRVTSHVWLANVRKRVTSALIVALQDLFKPLYMIQHMANNPQVNSYWLPTQDLHTHRQHTCYCHLISASCTDVSMTPKECRNRYRNRSPTVCSDEDRFLPTPRTFKLSVICEQTTT